MTKFKIVDIREYTVINYKNVEITYLIDGFYEYKIESLNYIKCRVTRRARELFNWIMKNKPEILI